MVPKKLVHIFIANAYALKKYKSIKNNQTNKQNKNKTKKQNKTNKKQTNKQTNYNSYHLPS